VINSWGASYVVRYRYTGTRDYTAFCAIPSAMDFIDTTLGGRSNVDTYIRNLAVNAGRLLTSSWGTSLLVAESMTAYIINVILPSKDPSAIGYMSGKLSSEHNFYFTYSSVVSTLTGETIYYTRLSAQVYLEMGDFEKLAYLVPSLLAEYVPPAK
jgi:hypothetical protein